MPRPPTLPLEKAASLVVALLTLAVPAFAWQANGVPLTSAATPSDVVAIGDGAGGAIVAWTDYRSAPTRQIYAQRIDANGTPQWSQDGVLVAFGSNDQATPVLVTDGRGGAIVAWADGRSGNEDIYAQHLDHDGVPLWNGGAGVAICTAGGDQTRPLIVTDGNANGALPSEQGAYVAWTDARTNGSGVYAQSLDGNGSVRWAANGEWVAANARNPALTSDASGNFQTPKSMIVAYELNGGIVAQRLNGGGTAQWGVNGTTVCSAHAQAPTLASSGLGAAIVAWEDDRSGDNSDFNIFAQRVSGGAVQWLADGLPVCRNPGQQYDPTTIADGQGGAIVTWTDMRALATQNDFYAQRLDVNGAIAWTVDGVGFGRGDTYAALADGAGGFTAAYSPRNADLDVYGQHLDGSGAPTWGSGLALCSATGYQNFPVLVADGSGGTIVFWLDGRSGTVDLYANHVTGAGGIAAVAAGAPLTWAAHATPNPARAGVEIGFELPRPAIVSVAVFDVLGRRVRSLIDRRPRAAGATSVRWDGRDDSGAPVRDGVFEARVLAGDAARVVPVCILR